MRISRFPWGRIINTFVYDFDGVEVTIIKFHPWVYENGYSTKKPDMEKIEYYCEEINQSADSLIGILITWMVEHQLGRNQGALTQGIARMLKLSDAL